MFSCKENVILLSLNFIIHLFTQATIVMKENKNDIIKYYDKLYASGTNFREEWEGSMSIEYKIPKYMDEFFRRFSDKEHISILEIGAGDGLISKIITSRIKCSRYIATEPSKTGVQKLLSLGIESRQMFAEDLKFKSDSFDLVCCFDVMHHSKNPEKMAQEMLRVSKDYVFLIEASSFCIIRKFLETTKKYKLVGENSYSPLTYKRFFAGAKEFNIRPFMFLFPNTPKILKKPAIYLSEFMEHTPLLRWQCGNLSIYVKKR